MDATTKTSGAAEQARTPRRVHLSLGRLAALVPATVLVVAGVAAAQPLTPTDPVQVPRQALEMEGGGTGQAMTFDPVGPQGPGDPLLANDPSSPQPPASGGSGDRVRVDGTGIPARALTAYRNAEQLLARADAGCRIDWALIGAIGRVESRHGAFGGNVLGADGVARPGIFGIALDGSRGTARIADTDGGTLDRDARFDRAVGPMQFIPGTWRAISQDGDGDGRRDPQDVDDAATATGAYLCSGPGDLSTERDAYRAVFRYNHSDDYVRTVLAIAEAYRRGVDVMPGGSLPAAQAGSRGSGVRAAGGDPAQAPAGGADRGSGPIVAGAQPGQPAGQPSPTSPPAAGAPGPVEGVVGAVGGAAGAVGGAVGGVVGGGPGGEATLPAPVPITCTTSPTQPLPVPAPTVPLPACPGVVPAPPVPPVPPLLP